MKHLIAVLLAVLLLAGFCASASADTEYTEGYFRYIVEDGSITITGYFGNETEVTIPNQIAGTPVNAVSPTAFAGTTVQTVYLPDTVRSFEQSGSNVTVIFNSNTDEPIVAEPDPDDGSETGEPEGEITYDEGYVEDYEVEDQPGQDTPADGENGETQDDPAGDGTDGTDGNGELGEVDKETQEQTSRQGLIGAVIAGALIACGALFFSRKRKIQS